MNALQLVRTSVRTSIHIMAKIQKRVGRKHSGGSLKVCSGGGRDGCTVVKIAQGWYLETTEVFANVKNRAR